MKTLKALICVLQNKRESQPTVKFPTTNNNLKSYKQNLYMRVNPTEYS